MQIVVDTNFWLIPGQFRVDIFAAFERLCGQNVTISCFSATLDELKKLAVEAPKSTQRKAAKLGLQLIEAKKVQIIPVNHGYADDAIVAYAREHKDLAIATQDQALKLRLKPLGAALIVLRARTHLQLITQSYK